MIRCANCGTLNRKGSKYCSNCGQALAAVAETSCPACARLNPPGSIHCKFCGALLSASVRAAEGADVASQESLPKGETTPAEQEKAKPRIELPSWLYEPTGPAKRPAPPRPVTVTLSLPEPSVTEQSENKYLKDIRGVLPSADAWLKLPTKPKGEEDKVG